MDGAKLSQEFLDRHRTKIAIAGPDQCWLWTAGRNRKGYGQVKARGKTRTAHREAFESAHGAGSADGLVVRHRCDVRACVNPAHLEPGTQADNNRDMMDRGRHVPPKGETHHSAKLTEADVVMIRKLYIRGSSDFGQYGLARRFGVNQSVINEVVLRKLWTHVA